MNCRIIKIYFYQKLLNFKNPFNLIIKEYKSIFYRKIRNKIEQLFKIRKWSKEGRPPPAPHLIRQKIVKAYAKKFSIKVLIETGTYLGDMVHSMRKNFSNIYSIELDRNLFERAKIRFSKYHHITLFHGDSMEILPIILSDINTPCVFWLDAHYSGGITAKGNYETPIIKELDIIFNSLNLNHIVLIDDARLFTGQNDYPTLVQLKKFILIKRPDWSFIVSEDIIRIYKKIKFYSW